MKVIILAGGGGTRLFPLSRESRPKQFLCIDNNDSLLVQTIKRFHNICKTSDIIVVTNQKYLYQVKSEAASCGAEDIHVISEPMPKNTAPAIALAAKYCLDVLKCDSDEVLFVSTSDHIIHPNKLFASSVEAAVALAQQSNVVTFGIVPTYPATGFGYIEAIEPYKNTEAYIAGEVKEKPDQVTAERYVKQNNFYWNSGMFAFTIQCYMEELAKYKNDIISNIKKTYQETVNTFSLMPDISIDYAIAEKTSRMVVFPLDLYWNDVGSWDAVHDVLEKDIKGNAVKGDCIALDCKNSLLLGNERLITGIGLEDIVVVDTPDVILVAHKKESQKIKDLVNDLKNRGRKEAVVHTTLYFPWGSETLLGEGKGYRMKKIIVNPQEKVSPHLHYHRTEHWVVAKGTAKIIAGDEEIILTANKGKFIPIAVPHSIENPGKIPVEIIELQSGEYLRDDDLNIV